MELRMDQPAAVALFVALSVLFPALAVAEQDENATNVKVEEYVVSPNDTLGSIALRFNVGVSDVKSWNGLESEDVRPGDRLVVKAREAKKKRDPLPIVHVIRKGDTLERIAQKYGVSTKKVLRWNKRLNPRKLRVGDEVRLLIPGRDGHSVSWGSANRGKLYNGMMLSPSTALRVRRDERAYGTRRTVQMLEAAAADVKARWPDAPALMVGDLSRRRGGSLRPHRSHQSGRDADLSYYHRGNVTTRDFQSMTRHTFDALKNWHLFKTLIDTGQVEYIFVDYRLQKQLYEYALSIGYAPSELESVLQYPHGRGTKKATIRHARGHDDHWHIRFTCGPRDKHCK